MTVARRIRIGDWLVPYDDATQEVVLDRTLADILNATPGDHADCMNTRCIQAQRNAHCFPHPVVMVSTIKSRVYIVDQLDPDASEPTPAHAVRYELSKRDSDLIQTHDRYGAGEPGELRLRIPRDPKGSPNRARVKQEGRFGKNGKKRHSGNGKRKNPTQRPITGHSLGAQAHYKVAVGGLNPKPKPPPRKPA